MRNLLGTRRISIPALAVALALMPAAALAESGSDQYCDPFDPTGGCSTPVDPGDGGTGGGGNPHGSPGGKVPTGQPQTPAATQVTARLKQAVQSESPADLEKVGKSFTVDPKLLESFRRQIRLKQARTVLEAAGLSSLTSTLPRR